MIGNRITHRTVDGVRIPGTWRQVFTHNAGHHFLTDLFIYADGLIDCSGLFTVEEFEGKLRTGWVATTLPDGAAASADGLGVWRFSEPRSWLTPDQLIAEIRDTIDQLNRRPDSAGRCLAAVEVFLADRTEENRAAARTAFLAVPLSERRAVLGDMDNKDWPLRVLVAGPGGRTYLPIDPPVTQAAYDRAVAYFEDLARWRAQQQARVPADGPEASHAPAVHLRQLFLSGPMADPGRLGLRNDYPVPITVGEITYPSVADAYWTLSLAPLWTSPRRLADVVRGRQGWEHARTAVMAGLLRAKYDQHPELAEVLLATGDAHLVYDDADSAFWGDDAGRGRNWTGRLLELVRSELHMRRAGIPGL